MLTRKTLDWMAIGPCKNPACNHSNHGAFYLHSTCHLDAPMFLVLAEPPAEATDLPVCVVAECPVCNSAVVIMRADDVRLLAGRWREEAPRLFEATCHPQDAVWLRYTYGSGIVEVVCYRCKEVVAQIGVK